MQLTSILISIPSTENAFATIRYIDGLVQDCSIPIANALEKQQSCTKTSICALSDIRMSHSPNCRTRTPSNQPQTVVGKYRKTSHIFTDDQEYPSIKGFRTNNMGLHQVVDVKHVYALVWNTHGLVDVVIGARTLCYKFTSISMTSADRLVIIYQTITDLATLVLLHWYRDEQIYYDTLRYFALIIEAIQWVVGWNSVLATQFSMKQTICLRQLASILINIQLLRFMSLEIYILCMCALSYISMSHNPSSIPLSSEFSTIVKTHIGFWRSRLYLTGVSLSCGGVCQI